jgi:hypothetical protein
MKHGDLLVFIGGNVIHSMFPATKDVNLNRNGCDWRISLLFRWTTPAMAKYGAGQRAKNAGTRQQYREAVTKWKEDQGE